MAIYMKEKPTECIDFTMEHVHDRDLVIKMLRHEEKIATGEWGQGRYRDPASRVSISLDNEYAFNRQTLHDFGFNTNDTCVDIYRSIFRTYFHGPDNYDMEVIGASYYMRNNRCVFYKAKPLSKGDLLPNCQLYQLDGKTQTDLHSAIKSSQTWSKGLICAFSNS